MKTTKPINLLEKNIKKLVAKSNFIKKFSVLHLNSTPTKLIISFFINDIQSVFIITSEGNMNLMDLDDVDIGTVLIEHDLKISEINCFKEDIVKILKLALDKNIKECSFKYTRGL